MDRCPPWSSVLLYAVRDGRVRPPDFLHAESIVAEFGGFSRVSRRDGKMAKFGFLSRGGRGTRLRRGWLEALGLKKDDLEPMIDSPGPPVCGSLELAAKPLLDVSKLNIFFRQRGGEAQVISDLSFAIRPGESVGIVGESGCGKTVTGLSLLSLLPSGTTRVTGRIDFEGTDLTCLGPREMRQVRGRRIAMIFQEPMSALDPVFTIGQQISETIRTHFKVGAKEARERATEALSAVGIPLPSRRYDEYPQELSGGMRQRALIAIALSCEPRLLIADEPTTALDVTVQAQIIDLLLGLTEKSGTALLFITHDLGVVAEACSRVITMYAGEIVEDAGVDEILARPLHPYTSGLLRSLPRLSPAKSVLPAIPGRVPSTSERRDGCRFAPRCAHVLAACADRQMLRGESGHLVRCSRRGELHLPGAVL